jgi:hypothetical protein
MMRRLSGVLIALALSLTAIVAGAAVGSNGLSLFGELK